MRLISVSTVLMLLCCAAPAATTYYVSSKGDDAKDGKSIESAWATCKKVNSRPFEPGDTILFSRGGEWRERLSASSSGAEGNPITYDAYGEGAKPIFWGSDLLENAKFIALGHDNYAYDIDAKADSTLQDHVFIASTWINGSLIITTPGTDPRANGKIYSACARGNVIYSNHKNHLVFRNLVVDETAGQLFDGVVQGYGVRIEGSSDVLMEHCEAYRCGRHHFAVINSTGFVGRHLHAEYVRAKTPGGNTFYCSYADKNAPVEKCTSLWDDISADHLEAGDPGHGENMCVFFTSHGDHQGLVTLLNVTAQTKVAVMSGPAIIRGGVLKQRGSIENWGSGALIDGVTLTDSSAIDQWASDGIIQNCVAYLTPERGGPTGYSTAIVLREKAKNNVVRFNTLVSGKFSSLCLAAAKSGTKVYGNIMLADGLTINQTSPLTADDVAQADYNFYGPNAQFTGLTLDAWKALGFDAHSLSGDPRFVEPAKHNYALQPDSTGLDAAKVPADQIPVKDFNGNARPQGPGPDMGGLERPVSEAPTPATP